MSEQNFNGEQSVILQNRQELSISGVLDVIGFDDESVLAETVLGRLSVKGHKLKVQSFAVETGSILIKGDIAAVIYLADNGKKSAISRLFG
ncbi:MAG: sporulation protein YabP [Clostridia bacterium]|nr:sporulation protein YabP [Clostridia bacterium]